jgi:hypothetical protein
MYWWNIEAELKVKVVVAQCFSTFLCPRMRTAGGCVYFGCAMSLTLVQAEGGEGHKGFLEGARLAEWTSKQ